MKDKFLRPCRKITDQFIIASVLSVLVMFIASLLIALVGSTLFPTSLFSNILGGDLDGGTFLKDYFDFIWIWVAVFIVVLVFKANWPMLRAFGPNRSGNNPLGLLAGLFLGFACNGFCVLMSVLKGDIHLSFSGFEAVPFFVFLGCVFIQSAGEEILDRWYLYQKLRRRYKSPVIAIVINSLVFMALHLPNPGVTALALAQIFVVGVLMSLFVYYYNGLWIAMAFHAGWNFTQSILFGLPNSGIVSAYSVFKLEAASGRNGLFYNVNFGVEGSVGAVILLALVTVILFLINHKKPERMDIWKQAEEEAIASAAASEVSEVSAETSKKVPETASYEAAPETNVPTDISDNKSANSEHVPKHMKS